MTASQCCGLLLSCLAQHVYHLYSHLCSSLLSFTARTQAAGLHKLIHAACVQHIKHALCNAGSLPRSSALITCSFIAGKSHIAPLVGEMLQRIQGEVARYERVISYWPSFGPSLEGAVCAALRTTTAAVSRQCGLIPMIGVSSLSVPTLCLLPMCCCVNHLRDIDFHEAFKGSQIHWRFAAPTLHASRFQCIAQSTQTQGPAMPFFTVPHLSQATAQIAQIVSSLAEHKLEPHSTSA